MNEKEMHDLLQKIASMLNLSPGDPLESIPERLSIILGHVAVISRLSCKLNERCNTVVEYALNE